jgi:nitrate reductase gamma subunit
MAIGAPKKRVFDAFIIASSFLLFIFYLGLHEGINSGQGSILGPGLFVISSFLGVLVALFFPLDAGGEFTTYKGKMHIILIVTSGLLTIAGMIALWLRLETVEGWQTFATYSLVSAIVCLILVIFSGIYANTKYRGIVERVMVTAYQIYYFLLGLMVFLNN